MNFLIITLSLVGLGAAAQQPSEAAALILKQDSQVFFDGSYHSSFETENGIFAEEEGNLKNTGKADAEAGEVRGFFQYTAPDGSLVRVEYTADENGFSPKGSHLPTPPSIPPEILRAQQYIAAQGQTEQELPYRRV
ncbi:endocuticle structural glycoprotein SgAbd-8-like [Cylas formicarius]|uniref:endocuticle structural glycoprotein SgAbd-8-like n=1 Tax=Cylas formicarius TaxID=197179 RepID=UPI002958B843|nr:endocuticle structural glycoprotein SgAbd-8-like [Cylas formicarius]